MRCLLLCLALPLTLTVLTDLSEPAQKPAAQEGVLPAGADSRPLNLDFETGTLQDWTAEGDAFTGQPIKGDTVFPRRSDMKSEHQGQYWVGGFERRGDKPQGTLTSAAFKVTHPWASFLVAGGPHPTTCVELVRKDTGKTFLSVSGVEEENLRRVAVDLRAHQGKEIFIRLVDRHSGHWGHVNFDDFRFHAQKPKVPARKVVQPLAALDVIKYAGLPPQKAAEAMTVPETFTVKLFAGEPDVHQPIAMCLDDRSRLWVVEGNVYPRRRPHKGPVLPKGEKGDNILIFEDADGDGKFDKRTVFMEGLNLVSGIEVGFGGVWVGAAPYLLFIPLDEKNDRPAGEPKILLDGWGYQDTHETLNAFIWGPDGWLYGCHGVFTHSRVGKPGTPDKERVPINAGVWRYHPTKHIFEVFAHGTSNPWGLDFNEHGQAFVEACVIPHLFHIIQGGRYHRQAGEHFNKHTYDDIKTIADHLHYLGATPHGGNNRSDAAGGGHAHCGLMVYLGGTWPKEYRGEVFMGNIHGRRINVDVLKPKGSGYVGAHGPDFLLANDAHARFINMRYGPDGNVYLIDWYDKQACHDNNPTIWDRTNGRIYKICWRGAKPVTNVDLRKLSDMELVKLQLHENDWYARHARRILQERGSRKAEALKSLEKTLREHKDETRRLRALWAYHVSANDPRALATSSQQQYLKMALADTSPYVRGWAIQLSVELASAPYWRLESLTLLSHLKRMAKEDRSPVVRLYVASACQRIPVEDRWGILEGLLNHSEDASDHNLPLMYWYAAEPLAEKTPEKALDLALKAKVPQILPFMVRRIGSSGTPEAIALLVGSVGKAKEEPVRLTILRGINEALKGRRNVPMPDAWKDVFAQLVQSKNAEVRSQAVALAVTFGDARAFDEMRRVLASTDANLVLRQQALASLLGARDKQLPPVLHRLLAEPAMRGAALRALAAYDDPLTPAAVLKVYPALDAAEKRDAVATLASRAGYAKALLDAVAARKVAAADVSADIVRQLRNLGDKQLHKQIAEVWGIVRDTPADRAKQMAHYRELLTSAAKAKPDLSLGRALFAKTCQQCHILFGVGGKVGPDITGSNRASLDYLLENILDPSAVIPKEYAASLIETNDGRLITGIVREQTQAALTVLTATETLTLPRADVANLKLTATSMMPDDQLKPLSDHEVRSLIAYMQSPAQVPMLATAENAKELFNGKDLTGWDGDPKLWKVEKGEIVGRSPGLKKNEFLRSHLAAGDFRLTLKVMLVPDKENSGIQFRSEALADGDVKGYQADVGAGWWGKLYEEHGRGLLWPKSGEPFVKADGWNDYEIVALGSRIRTYINGKLCVDLDDPKGARRGIFALQIHSGGPMEVRFRDLRLEVDPAKLPR